MEPTSDTQVLIKFPEKHVRQCNVRKLRVEEITPDYRVYYYRDGLWWELQQDASSVMVPKQGPPGRLMGLALGKSVFQFSIRELHNVKVPVYLNANGMIVRAFAAYEYE